MAKKTFLIFIPILAVAIFSGCSAVPTAPAQKSVTPSFTFSQSIWKSTDSGKTWQVKNKGEGKANTTAADILNLIVNLYDSNNIYAGLRSGGILETKNAGDAWSFMNNYTSEKVYGMALDPNDGRTLYASGVWQERGKMFKTQDDGGTWQELFTSPSKGPLIISLLADKKDSKIIYATTSENEALKSLDGGASWKKIYATDAPILKIAADASDNNLIYFITTSGTVFRSRDGGENFEDITGKISKTPGFNGNQFTILEIDPTVSGRVYLAGSGGMAVSNDSGESWKKIIVLSDSESFPIKAVAINPKNPQEIIYGAAQAVYKSVDGGTNWATSQFDNGMTINVLRYDPASSNIIYAGFIK